MITKTTEDHVRALERAMDHLLARVERLEKAMGAASKSLASAGASHDEEADRGV